FRADRRTTASSTAAPLPGPPQARRTSTSGGPLCAGGDRLRAQDRHPVGVSAAGMNCGCGMTCWRRLRDWNVAGVWRQLHRVLLDKLNAADKIDWSRAVV